MPAYLSSMMCIRHMANAEYILKQIRIVIGYVHHILIHAYLSSMMCIRHMANVQYILKQSCIVIGNVPEGVIVYDIFSIKSLASRYEGHVCDGWDTAWSCSMHL